ncbi:hypothetical protein NLJ89_g3762 [Agrocybe chaxingu]|uniref:Glycosyltransferase family 8 protein n=1 Tax=Agrocybe chaxingu TaxID=84603 RepID=A0A9W8K472_9AGAR|nr:hypothetical protein NLJ89_g3762 [Agrocybe chaxingu]
MPAYQFTPTQDWFSHNIDHWKALFPLVPSANPRVLEIGSWEGRSAVFLLENLCRDGGEIVCIDHFDLFHTEAGGERYRKMQNNLELTGKKSRIMAQFSVPALMTILKEEMSADVPGFDWIYVDGSHEADDTFLDGELVWRLARKGAIVIFDDYHWDKEPEDSIHHPKRGIDAFLLLHQGEYECFTDPSHYQVVLRKLTEMRIGFLIDDVGSKTNERLGYGIHIALAVDTAYAVGAAVTIRSIADTTTGRVSIYVVDCGLSEEDKAKLAGAGGDCNDLTIVFVQLPEDSLTKKMGACWAKLDMIRALPVERVLYIDSDTLVRKSLKELWNLDLGGRALGAAFDVGHPIGHEGVERRPYFNAGVMLMDLARIRQSSERLLELGKRMKNSKFRDQDAFNLHLADDWMPFGLEWNAQGLGTYARYPSDDRKCLEGQLERMKDPAIVHFTGPVHPSLVEVLNPWVQPPTAKPWGYVGAPGHPFENEWQSTLGKTEWLFKNSERVEEVVNEQLAKAEADYRAKIKLHKAA